MLFNLFVESCFVFACQLKEEDCIILLIKRFQHLKNYVFHFSGQKYIPTNLAFLFISKQIRFILEYTLKCNDRLLLNYYRTP